GAHGLEGTGRIVTAAALLISIVFLAIGTSSVTFIKLFGIGLTLAVLVDAFIIRGTLVPAFMSLAGDANWWAPRWMKRIHDRIGISESVDLEPAPASTAASTAAAVDAPARLDSVNGSTRDDERVGTPCPRRAPPAASEPARARATSCAPTSCPPPSSCCTTPVRRTPCP